jgi:hypothetical protein
MFAHNVEVVLSITGGDTSAASGAGVDINSHSPVMLFVNVFRP